MTEQERLERTMERDASTKLMDAAGKLLDKLKGSTQKQERSASSSEDWVCDYWKSTFDDFADAYALYRALMDAANCEPPFGGQCLWWNQKVISADQNMNLTKQLAEDDGCDTSGW